MQEDRFTLGWQRGMQFMTMIARSIPGWRGKRRHDLHFSPPPPPTAACHAAHAVMDTAPVFKVPSQDSEA